MKRISRLLKYLADYKGKIGLYFLFNLLSILFGLFSFTMIIPVLNTLFKGKDAIPTSSAVVSPSSTGITHLIQQAAYYFKNLILQQDRLNALAYICILVVVFTILKNLFLYLAVYILNPIRNAVLRRLRNDLFIKT